MIHHFDYLIKEFKPGIVEQTVGSLATAVNLPHVKIGEIVAFEEGQYGYVLGVTNDTADLMVLSRTPVTTGSRVVQSGEPLMISVDHGTLGKTLDPLGHVLESWKTKHSKAERRTIDPRPLSIAYRSRIKRFLETGIIALDLMTPLGLGQRELIIGDRKTGKSKMVQQIALHQAQQGVIPIIAMIGKRAVDVKRTENFLEKHGVRRKCVIIATTAEQSPGEIFLTPYTAMTVAEYFRDKGQDTLVIMDDLTTHAKYYRELSLVAGRFPGRESYPGDMFHIHSRLLERAGNFKIKGKEVAISCIPVAESVGGDVTGYIQTNLMSITDGHIFLDSSLFYQGIRPAINSFMSVTRVGRQTQTPLMRDITGVVTLIFKRYDEAQRFLRFGPELTDSVRETLTFGERLKDLFNQTSQDRVAITAQLVLIALLFNRAWDGKGAMLLGHAYEEDAKLASDIDAVVASSNTLQALQQNVHTVTERVLTVLTHTRYEKHQDPTS